MPFHVFVVFALSKMFPITAITAVPYVVITLIASTVVGILFFRLVEQPATSFLRSMPSWRVAPLEGQT
jgi:peptidoglycan/LPS O-acetylase OafA/YrhL